MRHFGVYSNVGGLRKDFPSILLDKALTPDCRNIMFWNGEVRTAKMRRRHMLRKSYSCESDSGTLYVDGDITPNIPDGSDVLLFDSLTGFYAVHEAAVATYNAGTDQTEFTASGAEPLQFAAPVGSSAVGPQIALYSAGMEANPASAAFLQVPVPDGNPIIHYHDHLGDTGDIYIFAFTKDHVYLWSTVLTDWLTAFAATECTHWSSVSFNGFLIITNDTDAPQVWNNLVEANCFDVLATDTDGASLTILKAKFVTAFEGHVVFGNYVLSDNSDYSNGIIISDLDDHLNWRLDLSDSDAAAFYVEGEGVIDGGFGVKGDLLYIFKDRSARVFWYTGDDAVMNSRPYPVKVGTIAPDSIVNDANGSLYFYASDMTFREVDLGVISNALGDDSRNIVQTRDVLSKMRSTYIDEYSEIWWAVPLGAQATDNNTVYCYKNGTWTQRDLAVSAFGKYRENENYTWDTLPFSSWEEWDWATWDSVAGISGWPLDLCGDASGFTYLSHGAYKDNGSAYTSYFTVSTDLGDLGLLRWYKRLLAIQLVLQREGGESITVYVKEDNETTWQTAGTIGPTNTNDVVIERLPVDYRAKRFEFKIESTSPFRFIGMEFDFNVSGER